MDGFLKARTGYQPREYAASDSLIRRAQSVPVEKRWGSGKGRQKHCFELALWTSHLKLSSSRVCWFVFVIWEEATQTEELSRSHGELICGGIC